MRIQVSAHDGTPIYAQIVRQVKYLVAAGRLAEGERLPSVRGLAEQLVVNPNTVARAYRELEALGVIETRGRAGSVVTGGGVDRAAREAAHAYAERLRALGLDEAEGVRLLRRAFS